MRSLEHGNMINDLHIENGAKSQPCEYPQYPELIEQTEFSRQDEWSPVLEDGSFDTSRSSSKKPPSEKAVTMALLMKKLLAAVAMIAALAIIIPDAMPALDIGGSALLNSLTVYPDTESASFYVFVRDGIKYDDLTVIVKNDFIKETGTVKLGEVYDHMGEDEDDYYSYDPYYNDKSDIPEHGIVMLEVPLGSAGPEWHYIEGSVFGLKPDMTYTFTIVCGGKTLYKTKFTTGMNAAPIEYYDKSTSSSHSSF